MKKAAIPALIVIIFIAFGIILAAVVIYWAINKFTEFVQGKCWADMDKTADSIKDELSKAGTNLGSDFKKITMGDCAGGIIIFNKGVAAASGFSQVIEDRCVKADSIKSYILVIPFKTLTQEAAKDKGFLAKLSEWLTHPVLSFKQVWEEGRQTIVRIKPICKSLDVPFDSYYCIPQGICGNSTDLSQLTEKMLNEKTISYCYKPLKVDFTTGGYAYRLEGLAECAK
ncbi:MAG: hypothetical protein MUP55_03170 [Candidatus Aenigmarchaeota archaeon]|nr:hypothetical protein [Candidatus Aenigmarchaeota archaeon]